MPQIITHPYLSPCGELILASFEDSLCLCDWVQGQHSEATFRKLEKALKSSISSGNSEVIRHTKQQLDAYFNGQVIAFDVPLLLIGTEFQQQVWRSLEQIAYGTTISYATQASRLGCPQAVRAVANANGRNPISIILPCHRVIGSNGKLTGYGGGLDKKRWLLDRESRSLFSNTIQNDTF